jgi:hypothetical protein
VAEAAYPSRLRRCSRISQRRAHATAARVAPEYRRAELRWESWEAARARPILNAARTTRARPMKGRTLSSQALRRAERYLGLIRERTSSTEVSPHAKSSMFGGSGTLMGSPPAAPLTNSRLGIAWSVGRSAASESARRSIKPGMSFGRRYISPVAPSQSGRSDASAGSFSKLLERIAESQRCSGGDDCGQVVSALAEETTEPIKIARSAANLRETRIELASQTY